ncbi:MAG TPA: glycosyltransferase family 4 protein, partial [Flavobacteriales bacterium]|nr:glycosyltransferase family 4 protein [Flavobacteriales bacterium]
NDTIEWARKAIADDPRIVLLEELPHAQVIEQMRKADVFVGTTFMDPFNNTVLEAMGCRVPVICSDVGALPEVVRDGTNGWMLSVKGRTSDEIAEEVAARLRQLMDDPGLRQRMGTANDAIIGERFNLQVRNAALGRLYDAALADR